MGKKQINIPIQHLANIYFLYVHTTGALSVIQAGVSIDGNDDGLIEVEIDQIDDATLWKLYDYLLS